MKAFLTSTGGGERPDSSRGCYTLGKMLSGTYWTSLVAAVDDVMRRIF
jgi:hypothetical protein